MFPAPRGIVARYKHETGGTADITGKPYYTHKHVVAFDDDGRPYVVPDEGKRLMPADHGPNYVGIAEDRYPEIVALMPTAGWRVQHTGDDGTTWSEPLIGWGLRANGDVVPLETDSGGFVDVPVGSTVYRPDEEATSLPLETVGVWRVTEPPVGGLIYRPGETRREQNTDPKEDH